LEHKGLHEMTAHALGVDPYMAASDSQSRGGELESTTDEDDAMTSLTARMALMLM
jgi:hypothetical protein